MRTTLDEAIMMAKGHHPTLEGWKVVEMTDLVQYGCSVKGVEPQPDREGGLGGVTLPATKG